MAVRTSDIATRDQLSYARLILQEALRHGGTGWVDYDRLFRKQAAINPALPWNALQPTLNSSLILGQRSSSGTFCSLCRGSDHAVNQCALTPLQQTQTPPITVQGQRQRQAVRRPESLLRICASWNKGTCTYPGCTYQHTCAICQEAHKARDYPDVPEG